MAWAVVNGDARDFAVITNPNAIKGDFNNDGQVNSGTSRSCRAPSPPIRPTCSTTSTATARSTRPMSAGSPSTTRTKT
ncbi:MAG: hypothetical protein WDO13_17635 [Verrucomicrobiota bacterium]